MASPEIAALVAELERFAGSLEDHFVSQSIDREPTPAIDIADAMRRAAATLSALAAQGGDADAGSGRVLPPERGRS